MIIILYLMAKEVKITNGVNPTLKFLLSNNTIVNIILLISFVGVIILSIISAQKGWFGQEIILNIIFTIVGTFFGAQLLRYANKK